MLLRSKVMKMVICSILALTVFGFSQVLGVMAEGSASVTCNNSYDIVSGILRVAGEVSPRGVQDISIIIFKLKEPFSVNNVPQPINILNMRQIATRNDGSFTTDFVLDKANALGWYQICVGTKASSTSAKYLIYCASEADMHNAIDAVNACTSPGDLPAVFNDQAIILNLNTAVYEYQQYQQDFCNEIINIRNSSYANQKFQTISDIQNTFNQVLNNIIEKNKTSAFNSVNASGLTPSGLAEVIDHQSRYLGVNLTDDYNHHKQDVCAVILTIRAAASNQFNSIQEFQKAFTDSVAIQGVNAANEATMGNTLVTYKDVIGLSFTDDFYTVAQSVYSRMISLKLRTDLKKFASVNEIQISFSQAIPIEKVNHANPDTLTAVFEKYRGLIGIVLTDDYYKNKFNINNGLVDRDFGTLEEIKTAFDSRYSEIIRPVSTGGSNTGSGKGKTSDISGPAMGPYVPVNAFQDIDHVEWAVESINSLAAKGIIAGYEDGTFKPDSNITREQFLKMLIQGFELIDENAVSDFADVKKDDWYYKYIASAQKLGITNGLGNGSFGVGFEITREEMAALAYRVAGIANISLSESVPEKAFADANSIDEYALGSIAAMQKAGIISGMEDGRFAPNEHATRAQAAKIIFGLIDLLN